MAARPGVAFMCVLLTGLAAPVARVVADEQAAWNERLEHPWSDQRIREFPPEFVEEGPETVEGFYESLRTLTLWRLAETLDLGEEELVHFFPRFSQLEKSRQEYREERAALLEALEEALASDDLKRIKGAMRSFRQARERHRAELRDLEDKLLEVLALEQQARYLIFMETVAPEIEGMLRAFRQLRS